MKIFFLEDEKGKGYLEQYEGEMGKRGRKPLRFEETFIFSRLCQQLLRLQEEFENSNAQNPEGKPDSKILVDGLQRNGSYHPG